MSKVDLELSDIQHVIELSTFNASEGYKLCKMLKDKLSERREIKDRHRYLQTLSSNSESLKKIETRMTKLDTELNSRRYKTRVMTEVFGHSIQDNNKINFKGEIK